MKKNKKIRLDLLLVERGLAPSRTRAQTMIMAGEVWQGQVRLSKPGLAVDPEIEFTLRGEKLKYVSRAGFKLEHALEFFKIRVEGRTCLDVGASTGGFTDCLLQHGAKHVFAVDVGYGQLDSYLRNDPRVTCIEDLNVRLLTPADTAQWPGPVADIDFVCVDVSFISLKKVTLPIYSVLRKNAEWVLLFKPQFEVGRAAVGKGGLVRDQTAVTESLSDFQSWLATHPFVRRGGPESSPLAGKKSGNVEYLLHYESSSKS